MDVKIKIIEGGIMPERKTCGAVGFDCYARLEKPLTLKVNERAKIPLGFCIQMPDYLGAHVTPRSGLTSCGADSHVGTIDWDYTGEVCAIVENKTGCDYIISNGDRIAQLEFVEVPIIRFVEKNFTKTERGDKGYGSTGI